MRVVRAPGANIYPATLICQAGQGAGKLMTTCTQASHYVDK